jgi:hypothetical protein
LERFRRPLGRPRFYGSMGGKEGYRTIEPRGWRPLGRPRFFGSMRGREGYRTIEP